MKEKCSFRLFETLVFNCQQLVSLSLVAGMSIVSAQLVPKNVTPSVRTKAGLTPGLFKLVQKHDELSKESKSAGIITDIKKRAKISPEVIDAGRKKKLTITDEGRILVELVAPNGKNAKDSLIDFQLRGTPLPELGISAGRTAKEIRQGKKSGQLDSVESTLTAYGNRVELLVPIDLVLLLSESLPENFQIEEVVPPKLDEVIGEGPGVVNSIAYENNGSNGAGISIAVIDSGFSNLTQAKDNGDAPNTWIEVNYVGGGFEDGTNRHGTGCVEAMFDHAPGSTYRLYRVESSSDMASAVQDAIDNGVDIISHSMSWYNTGWEDDTGTPCNAAQNASDNNVLFFTSAGNRALSHYQEFYDEGQNSFHDFGSGDQTIHCTIDSMSEGSFFLSWSNQDIDFDLRLYNSDLSMIVAEGNRTGNGLFESLDWTNSTGSTQNYHLAVVRMGGTGTSSEIEIFGTDTNWLQHQIAQGSTTSPSNSTAPLVISVGAVDEAFYGSGNGSTVIENYSSQGPGNSGMILPDIVGPTDTTGFSYPSGFGGTSCATPNAAGATAAFWSQNTSMSAEAIWYLIQNQAALWRDWGGSGNDNIYGNGGIRLIDYSEGTRWLIRDYPGTLNNGTVPYHALQSAYNGTPDGGRLLIWGSNYPENPTLNLNKTVRLELVPDTGSAVLGSTP